MTNRKSKLVLITGSRDWPDEERAKAILRYYLWDADVVMHGANKGHGHHPSGNKELPWGADYWASVVAEELGVRQEAEPYIGALGKRGGIVRNQKMIDRCVAASKLPDWEVIVVALHHNQSKGTGDCISRAVMAGLTVYGYTMDQELPINVKENLRE